MIAWWIIFGSGVIIGFLLGLIVAAVFYQIGLGADASRYSGK